jgi:peptide/nickel transport system substrate-binding protein
MSHVGGYVMKTNYRLLVIALFALLAIVATACSGEDAEPAAPAEVVATSVPATAKAAPAEVVATSVPATAKAAPTEAVTSDGPRRGGEMIFGVRANFPSKWDMTQDSVYSSPQHFARHYNGLLQFSARDGSTVIPSLASEWDIAGDATEFTLKIEDGLQWHDGTALTIDDVIWAVDRWANPPEGIKLPRVAGFKSITDVSAVGSDSIKITIDATNVGFLLELADPWHIIVPRHIAESGIDDGDKIVGTGPWMLDTFERDNFVKSKPNPNYHRNAPDGSPFPYLDSITSIQFPDNEPALAALKTGRIDMLSEQNVESTFNFEKDEGDSFKYEQWINPGLTRLGLNNTRPPFDNVQAREAIYLAIDRSAYVDILQTPGLPVLNKPASFFGSTDPAWDDAPNLFGYGPATRDAALAKAKQLAEDSGLMEYDGELSILVNKGGSSSAEILQQLLEESLGFNVEIEVTDTSSMFARFGEKDFDLGRYGTGVLHLSPMSQILADWAPGAGRNYGWEPPQNWLDLFEESKRTLQGPELDANFAEMDRIMREEWIPSVPLERVSGSSVIRRDYVKNFDALPGCKFKCFQLEDVWVTEDAPSNR